MGTISSSPPLEPPHVHLFLSPTNKQLKKRKLTTSHVLDQPGEELLVLQVSVVVLEVLNGSVNHLHRSELVSTLLKSSDDLSDESYETSKASVGAHTWR